MLVAFSVPQFTQAPLIAQAQIPEIVPTSQGTYTYPKPLPRSVLTNCYAFVRIVYPSFPPSADVRAHLQKAPADVAVFDYHGLPHFAVVTEVSTSTFSITETNYKSGEQTSRVISLKDPYLQGFFAIHR